MSDDVSNAIQRLRRAPDVQHVAVMPDVHLAEDVCVGVAMATARLLYPQAIGGDWLGRSANWLKFCVCCDPFSTIKECDQLGAVTSSQFTMYAY